MNKKDKILWICWETQIRNRSMANALKVDLYEILSTQGKIVRFLTSTIRTIHLFWQTRPHVVICQCPSVALTLLTIILRKLFRFKVVVDAHFGGVLAPVNKKNRQRLLNFFHRSADLTIVTNQNHAEIIKKNHGTPFICQDPFPDLDSFSSSTHKSVPGKVLLVCSFDSDEPYLEVFKAARDLKQEGFSLFVSGNFKKVGLIPENYPHVKLLGFVPAEEFYRHLFTAEIIMDLTDNDNCLVCGAYEAMQAGKPLVLSDKKALQDYFTGGVVFTENRAEMISKAVKEAQKNKKLLVSKSTRWLKDKKEEMATRLLTLNHYIEHL